MSDLWVRSKDKRCFFNVEKIEITPLIEVDPRRQKETECKETIILVNGHCFGTYETEKRAIEIVDEIRDAMDTGFYAQVIYQLPEK